MIYSPALNVSLRGKEDRTAIIANERSVSYGAIIAQINRAAAALLHLGCKPGDRILICLPDSLEFVVAFFASGRIGAVPVPVSPYVSSADYRHYLLETEASILITESSIISNIPTGDRNVVIVDKDLSTDGFQYWERLLDQTGAVIDAIDSADADDLGLLLYTSGSTNRQKCVMHSHKSLEMACRNVGVGVFGFGPDDRVLSIPKPFFAFGLGFGVLFPLFVGGSTIVTSKRVDVKEAVEFIRLHRPTVLCAIPSFLSVLLQARSWLDVDLSSLRFVASAGEALGKRLFHAFSDTFGVEVVDGIGSTEMLTHFITNRPAQSHPGSCGVEVPGCEICLVDQSGRPVQDGEIGSLMIKGPTRFMGYWRNPDATMRVCRGDWLLTGDNLHRDSAGRYYYCGRNDDMLKVSGVWIMPQEIEAALCQYSEVGQAFVTTREDDAGRRRLVAYIVPKNAAKPSDMDLVRFLGARLPHDMIPAAFVIVQTMPLTSNGKVNRSALPTPAWRVPAAN
jgi:acyl-coenzyme A synthetase/AMP-(fatty) acid ligase